MVKVAPPSSAGSHHRCQHYKIEDPTRWSPFMPRPVHFEIQAADTKRAIAYYTALFGWTFNKWEGPQDYWLIKTGEAGTMGIDGGLLPRHGPPPVPMQGVNAY